MSETLDITVRDSAEQKRWEALVDEQVIGYADYIKTEELIVFTHTVVQPEFEGKGVAGTLVRAALDAAREDGTREVMPQCSYVKHWITKHPEYIPLVYGAARPAAD
ncbi:GNAT family N-acetyltransferase [Yimella sp. cx-51]|uniref:GNAT family N-acetyltransferase n=1 Tax=Yimella sp. cx-51 TaxID=2770551 RepID=UPI00165E5B88|nr:GNAT family N-acetyltransferase [Yimella sp. cx-51]MBC9958296.1 N-acetyltransferase [Yimella sp. cx-51]QTH38256.1 N-acetyltransferase [Yimella sp. cx-51]